MHGATCTESGSVDQHGKPLWPAVEVWRYACACVAGYEGEECEHDTGEPPPPPIDAPCTQCLRHGDPIHAKKGLTLAAAAAVPTIPEPHASSQAQQTHHPIIYISSSATDDGPVDLCGGRSSAPRRVRVRAVPAPRRHLRAAPAGWLPLRVCDGLHGRALRNRHRRGDMPVAQEQAGAAAAAAAPPLLLRAATSRLTQPW